jgi:hypothetical protein
LVAIVIWRPELISRQTRHQFIVSAAIFLGLNLLHGLATAEVDLAAHAGGFGLGVLMGFLLGKQVRVLATRPVRNLCIAGSAAAFIVLFLIPASSDFPSDVETFAKMEGQLVGRLNEGVRHWSAGEINNSEFEKVATELLQQWRKQRAVFLREDGLSEEQQRLANGLVQYATLRMEALSLLARAAHENSARVVYQARAKQQEADRVAAKLGKVQ